MEITISQIDARVKVTVMQVQGMVDSSNFHDLVVAGWKAALEGTGYLLIDLSECDYMSSAGIRSLNEIFRAFRGRYSEEKSAHSQRVKLLNPSSKLREIFDISGVDVFFEIHTNLQTAVASF